VLPFVTDNGRSLLVVLVHYVVFDNKTASFLLLSVNWFAYCVTMLINAAKTANPIWVSRFYGNNRLFEVGISPTLELNKIFTIRNAKGEY
jgi:hypothetical protein